MDLHKNFWNGKYSEDDEYQKIGTPSDFLDFSLGCFPPEGKVLELGAGTGADTAKLLSLGYEVVATDFSNLAVKNLNRQFHSKNNFSSQAQDLHNLFPFKNNSFDIVFAHLVIHYFDDKTTKQIYREIYRVLKPGGVIALAVNGLSDPDYKKGKKLGKDFYEERPGRPKRFFTTETLKPFLSKFKMLILDEDGIDSRRIYKNNLVRFIGQK